MVAGARAQQGCEQGAQVAVGEAVGQEPKDQQGVEQRLDASVGEPQPGDRGAGVGGQQVTYRHLRGRVAQLLADSGPERA